MKPAEEGGWRYREMVKSGVKKQVAQILASGAVMSSISIAMVIPDQVSHVVFFSVFLKLKHHQLNHSV